MMISSLPFTGFDIIGDVHGCASALEELLGRLGYRETADGYRYHDERHPRQAVFVGDLIDRGANIHRTLSVVKAMFDNGSAQVVMGNHEFNAIAYHTPVNDDFLRPRNDRSNQQIRETLAAFRHNVDEWESYLAWFKTLPLFLEFEQFRVVHACWDKRLIGNYLDLFNTNRLPDDFEGCLFHHDSLPLRLVDRLTKGVSLPFPDGQYIRGRDGFYRKTFRVDFWTEPAAIYDDIVFQPDPIPDDHRIKTVSDTDRQKLINYPVHEKPLFIGHYWLSGMPSLVRQNIACLDYSAVNQGKLVAYRFNVHDIGLSNRNFVYVDSTGG